jgi:hypothetical protein
VFRVAAAVAAARGKLVDQAAAFLARAEALAGMWRGGPWPASLDEARGEIAYASGDLFGARAQLRASADAFTQDGRRLDADRVEARLNNLE